MRCLNIAKNRETEMMKFLGIKHRITFRSDYLNPLLDEGKIAMTLPDSFCFLYLLPSGSPAPADHSASEISKFEAEESEKSVNHQIGVISKNKLNKSFFQGKLPTINISETKIKHYANNEVIFSYHQMKHKNFRDGGI